MQDGTTAKKIILEIALTIATELKAGMEGAFAAAKAGTSKPLTPEDLTALVCNLDRLSEIVRRCEAT